MKALAVGNSRGRLASAPWPALGIVAATLCLTAAGCSEQPAPTETPLAVPKVEEGAAADALTALGAELTRADLGRGPVIKAHLEDPRIDDDALKNLAGLADLKWLYLSPRITDAGLQHVAEIPGIERLYLEHSQVTDEGLAALSGLRELQIIDLSNTGISDEGLRHMPGRLELRYLRLENTGVTDAGLKHLVGLPRLTSLNVLGTKVTPAGAAEFRAKMKQTDVVR